MAGRDHGGGIDEARARYGGSRGAWLDLSTGINPEPYPVTVAPEAWTSLPDSGAMERLLGAARAFWTVPEPAAIVAGAGASALIAQIPFLAPAERVSIPARTYNEHAASFRFAGWEIGENAPAAVIVHPNNPDGALYPAPNAPFSVIDESFCDVSPEASHIAEAARPGRIVLKSFGKFWGLAGLRLGFAIGDPALIEALAARLGPWAVPGPALEIGARALEDEAWAAATRIRLAEDAARLDALLLGHGARAIGGTSLFRLYDVADAAAVHDALAQHHVLTRVFPYSRTWLRLGMPPRGRWEQLERALETAGGTAGGVIRAGTTSRGSAVPSS
ncbi:MAG: aminotransferase class I/II-fold pyridoxal phosphate-dependent enzyme [Pseudomonadota bacterium]